MRVFQSRFGSRLIFFVVFFVLYGFVRGAFGPESTLGLFVAPAIAGVVTVVFSFWVRGYLLKRNG